jgi:aminocarboxymuconate-semialdehyde decarboxylase
LKLDAIIDVHSHVPPALSEMAKQEDQRSSLATEAEKRIAVMDSEGIDLRILSARVPTPLSEIDTPYCRRHNELLAAFVKDHPDRLRGFSLLDLRDVDGSIIELRRSVEELGLLGPYLRTDPGIELDDPRLDPFYETLEELNVPLFLHGAMAGAEGMFRDPRFEMRPGIDDRESFFQGNPNRDRTDITFGRWGLRLLIGFPYEETLAAVTLIFGGVLDRHPSLQVCFSHGGGLMPFLAGTIRQAGRLSGLPERFKDPTEFDSRLRRLWFDSEVEGREVLQLVIETVGADHVVLGTNNPGWNPSPLPHIEAELQLQMSRNARRLLRLD